MPVIYTCQYILEQFIVLPIIYNTTNENLLNENLNANLLNENLNANFLNRFRYTDIVP